MKFFIAIDDTDNKESIGTGRLSRMLVSELQNKGLVSTASVTRHQLLVHPDIPYTSHNSSACIEAIALNQKTEEIFSVAKEFLVKNFQATSNPGLCIASPEAVTEELQNFGLRAQKEVLTIVEARSLAQRMGLTLWWYGDTGQGCIGAMAGVGLRGSGNDGRFIDLEGIRKLKGTMSVGEILRQSGVKKVLSLSGNPLHEQDLIDTGDWIRPSLLNKEAVLLTEKEGNVWKQVGGKSGKSAEE